MVHISEEVLEAIRQKANIVDYIGRYVSLKLRGKNYFGHCPFHDEKTPSFSVNEEKQIFKCFSCGRGGGIFQFVMEHDQVDYVQAVRKVAETYGVPVTIDEPNLTPQQQQQQAITQQLVAIHQEAMELYHHILTNTTEGQVAREYLYDRGFTDETIKTFRIGVAPNERKLLATVLRGRPYRMELLQESGLFVQRDDQLLDRFYQRIMFPLIDERGQVVGFSGRILPQATDRDPQQAKYLNSPETAIFHKSRFLFHLYQARATIRKLDEVVLCEGFMDVIALWQAGIGHAVASMGTSLTLEQVRRLQKLTDHAILAYDGDDPGVDATYRALDLLRRNSQMVVRVLPMEAGLDPDEMVQRYGAEAMRRRFDSHLETAFQFYQRYYQRTYQLGVPSDKVAYIEQLARELAWERSSIARSMAISELATQFSLSAEVLEKQVALHQRQAVSEGTATYQPIAVPTASEQGATTSRLQRAEQQLLYRLLTNEELALQLPEAFHFQSEGYQRVYFKWLGYCHVHASNPQQFLATLTESSEQRLVSDALWHGIDEPMTPQELADLLRCLEEEGPIQDERTRLRQVVENKLPSTPSDSPEQVQVIEQLVALRRQREGYLKKRGNDYGRRN